MAPALSHEDEAEGSNQPGEVFEADVLDRAGRQSPQELPSLHLESFGCTLLDARSVKDREVPRFESSSRLAKTQFPFLKVTRNPPAVKPGDADVVRFGERFGGRAYPRVGERVGGRVHLRVYPIAGGIAPGIAEGIALPIAGGIALPIAEG